MRALIQRVLQASVTVEGQIVGQIGQGLLVLLGITHSDTEQEAKWLAEKTTNLRIFADEDYKMNLSVKDVEGEILVVSQFTLYGTGDKGRRPEFTQAARGDEAQALYKQFIFELEQIFGKVETGQFGAKMQVASINDGPVTLLLERKRASC